MRDRFREETAKRIWLRDYEPNYPYRHGWGVADPAIANLCRKEAGLLLELILSIKVDDCSLEVVDWKAKVPQREKLAKGSLLLNAEDKNDIYLNGQIFAQEQMLKANFRKVIEE